MTRASPVAVGVDLGATKIAAGLVDATGRIVERRAVPTLPAQGADAVIDRVAEQVRALAAAGAERGLAAPAGVGVGVAGLTRAREGVVADCPNLHGWKEVPLGAKLAERLGPRLAVAVDNDANAAAIGEAWAAAG